MNAIPFRFGVLCVVPILIAYAAASEQPGAENAQNRTESKRLGANQTEGDSMQVYYLEIVTPLVDQTCRALEKTHDVTFGEPIAELGNARTVKLKDGGRIGVRAPMRDTEEPVVRPYILVNDIDAAIKAAEAAGAEVAMRPTKIPGHGAFAIYLLGGIDHGLWQL